MNSSLDIRHLSLTPPTYPARPINGGPLDKARPKAGRWCYEPKINGWRTLVHCPSGAMFNREGKRLSIEREFDTVLHVLEDATNDPAMEWLDCEALERRLPLGRGSLIILDAPGAPGDYEARQQHLYDSLVGTGAVRSWAFEQWSPPDNSLLSFAYHFSDDDGDFDLRPASAWTRLQALNQHWGAELFEGLVAKRADSQYPIQLQDPQREFHGWMKHRWH